LKKSLTASRQTAITYIISFTGSAAKNSIQQTILITIIVDSNELCLNYTESSNIGRMSVPGDLNAPRNKTVSASREQMVSLSHSIMSLRFGHILRHYARYKYTYYYYYYYYYAADRVYKTDILLAMWVRSGQVRSYKWIL